MARTLIYSKILLRNFGFIDISTFLKSPEQIYPQHRVKSCRCKSTANHLFELYKQTFAT